MRNGYTFLYSFYESLKDLKPLQKLAIYDAITEYAFFDKLPELPATIKGLFSLIKPILDSFNNKYDANVKNGKKGGRPKKNPNKTQSNPTITQTKPNRKQEKEKEKEKETEKDKETEKEIQVFSLSQKKFHNAFPKKNINADIPPNIDVNILISKVQSSEFLQKPNFTLKWLVENYSKLDDYSNHCDKQCDDNFTERYKQMAEEVQTI